MEYIVKINGEFEKGDCYSCPLSHESYNIDGERVPACAPFERSVTCPLEVVTENETPGEQTGWIPTSERLPETGTLSLIYLKIFEITIIGQFSKNDNYWEDSCGCKWAVEEAAAWMPLPEPYKKGGK